MVKKDVLSKSEQVRLKILETIETGQCPVGCCIASENELAEMTGTSRVTVRDAISKLVSKGYLKRIQGKGTLVVKSTGVSVPRIKKPIILFTVSSYDIDLFSSGILVGVHQRLLEEDCPVMVKKNATVEEITSFIENNIVPGEYRGAILTGALSSRQLVDLLEEKNIPCVSIGSPVDGAGIPYAEANHIAGARMAVEELLSKGHEKIAFVDFDFSGHEASVLAREEGVKRAFESKGLEYDPDLVFHYPQSHGQGIEFAKKLIKREVAFTAVVIVGYGFLTEFIGEIISYGMKIPDDMSIISYRAYQHYNDMTGLHFTSVTTPLDKMGRAAADLVLGGVEYRRKAVIFEPVFINGQTVSEK